MSLLTGAVGAAVPAFMLGSPWGEMIGFLLFVCVGVAHNWLATGKL
jgi:hypothetical protein